MLEQNWREPMIECLRGQMETLTALATLVPRDMRLSIKETIQSHADWITRLAGDGASDA